MVEGGVYQRNRNAGGADGGIGAGERHIDMMETGSEILRYRELKNVTCAQEFDETREGSGQEVGCGRPEETARLLRESTEVACPLVECEARRDEGEERHRMQGGGGGEFGPGDGALLILAIGKDDQGVATGIL